MGKIYTYGNDGLSPKPLQGKKLTAFLPFPYAALLAKVAIIKFVFHEDIPPQDAIVFSALIGITLIAIVLTLYARHERATENRYKLEAALRQGKISRMKVFDHFFSEEYIDRDYLSFARTELANQLREELKKEEISGGAFAFVGLEPYDLGSARSPEQAELYKAANDVIKRKLQEEPYKSFCEQALREVENIGKNSWK